MSEKPTVIDFSSLNFARLGTNFLNERGSVTVDELNKINDYIQYCLREGQKPKTSFNIGIMLICINQNYWQYALQVIQGIKAYFLPGHNVEIMMWSDIANWPEAKDVNYGTTVFPTDSVGWPYPTLMRYHIFLQQEEYLKKFDYLFYLDLDMRVVNVVGDEILGSGLTAAQHPMYALRQPFQLPYEPNPASQAYIKQSGRYLVDPNGKPYFEPLYAAGGFQGGKTEAFIEAMKAMQKGIDKDFDSNYIARWNDESHWNRYLYDNPPSVVLSPSYVYPDSLIKEYYIPLWGRDYVPKIITLTKPFTTSKEGGAHVRETLLTLK